MSASGILEIAFGLAFVYLLVALLCSAIAETVSSVLDRRAKYLQQAIRRLLSPGTAQAGAKHPDLATRVLDHGLIQGLLASKRSAGPSYIPARTFALAVFDALAPETPTSRFAAIRQSVGQLPEGKLRQSLLALLDDAGQDLDQARERVEKWFDDAMERVSGMYKRWTHVFLFVTALAIAAIGNIDTIQITRRLFTEPALRAALADAARDYVKEHAAAPEMTPTASPTPATETSPAPPVSASPADSGAVSTQPTPAPSPAAAARPTTAEAIRKSANELSDTLTRLHLPFGWSEGVSLSFLKVFGLLLTAVAASFGAPFWFDALNKLVSARLAGQKPQASSGKRQQ